jgi:hypothetical protein
MEHISVEMVLEALELLRELPGTILTPHLQTVTI